MLVYDVFANGYIAATRPTVMVAVAALGLASASCLLVVRRRVPASESVSAPQRKEAA